MLKQLFLTAMLLAVFAGSAFAASTPPQVFDVNVVSPASGLTYYPNLKTEDKCIDFNIQVFDTNAAAPIHRLNIDFNTLKAGDSNRFMFTDLNLSSANCSFHGVTNNWGPGADCHVKYCFNGVKIPNGTYALDVNVAGYSSAGSRDTNARQVLTFTVDNRFIDSTTQAMLNLLPIAMALVVILFVVLGMMGIVGMDMVTKVLPMALAAIVGIIILTQVLQIMLGA